VREALFMTSSPSRTRVVDLFAGSGALGIEALSRGAARADFVDSDRAARAALEANLDALATRERARIWPLTLPAGLGRMRAALGAADLVLADPPYGGRIAVATLEALGAEGVLREGARVVARASRQGRFAGRRGRLAARSGSHLR
jgi:16S rRNA (guanine966-N2)-methyltransferase